MQMKRFIACLMIAAAFCLCVPALAEEPPTAEELFAQYPVPEVPITSDPSADPNLKLVNKKNKLPWDYVPELVIPNVRAKKNVRIEMTPVAAKALEDLFTAAQTEGFKLVAISGYRSYSTQKAIYQRSVAKNGKSHADLASAQAGKSEHQLGLAADVSCDAIKLNLNKSFATTKEGVWLYGHCADFGFIVRYKTEWVKTTGYKGEPWHIRYVGKEQAQFITKLNVPFDTYMAYLQMYYRSYGI